MNKAQQKSYDIKGAETIMKTKYPEFDFFIENLIPSYGLVLLAGAPKVGKSWFVLQMLLSICYNEEKFLNYSILKRSRCLYLALEDSELRIQKRIEKQGIVPKDENLLIAFSWRTNEGGVHDLKKHLKENEDIKLVCIDTKGKFSEGRDNESFQSDYAWMGELKKLADELKVAIILITHFRKKKADEDPFEVISGSFANMAAADTTIMLTRFRNQNKATLLVTSRDFQEYEEDIYFDPTSCTWSSGGKNIASVENLTPERDKIIEALKELGGEASPLEISKIVGGTSKNISNMLTIMSQYGFVEKGSKRGLWKIATSQEEFDFE